MTTTNDGGPAFPMSSGEEPRQNSITHYNEGMSLRDWFAGQALKMIVINDVSGRPENFREHYSKGAYAWADAMLAARKAKP